MKHNQKLGALLAAVTIILGWHDVARAQRARVSPHESTAANVDGSAMSIEYGRPSMRGREIFGRLVPYGDVWCPGADEATMLSTSRPLRIGPLAVPAGEYSLWILPTEGEWTLILNKEAHTFHTNYRGSRDLGRVPLQKRALTTPVEQLTFAIEQSSAGAGGRIVMSWATTEVSVPFMVGN
jgi:hypothetical protein